MKYFRIHSIRMRLLFQNLLVSLVLIIALLLGYIIMIEHITSLNHASMSRSLEQINTETGKVFENTRRVAENIAQDSTIQSYLRVSLPDNDTEKYAQFLECNNHLYYEAIETEYIDGIYVIGQNGSLYHSYYQTRKEEYRYEDWYQRVYSHDEAEWLEPVNGSRVGNNLWYNTVSIAVPIDDRASTRVLGVVVVDILTENLAQINSQGNTVFPAVNGILNKENKVIYLADNESGLTSDSLTSAIKAGSGYKENTVNEITVDKTKYLFCMSGLEQTDWNLICLVTYDDVYGNVNHLRIVVIAIIVAVIFLTAVISLITSKQLTIPLINLQKVMKQMENGDKTVAADESSMDEIGDVGRGLNHMMRRIDEAEKKEVESQKKLMQSELNALQSQINPHFLYNTLDSINWLARMNRPDKVEEMISALTDFLRIGLSRGRTIIPLKNEIRHVESYLQIQKFRYHSILNYKIQISEDLYPYEVIKMILQPLVENALYHGLKEKGEPGLITIRGRLIHQSIELIVEDNGMGMTEDRLQEVQHFMQDQVTQSDTAYGIINVQRRIQSYFGREYGLHFESELNKGTTVTIILPARRGITDV